MPTPVTFAVTGVAGAGTYASLDAALAALIAAYPLAGDATKGDVVTADIAPRVEIQAAFLDTTVVNRTITTDPTHPLVIEVMGANRWRDKWDTTKYRLSTNLVSASGLASLTLTTQCLTLIGLQVQNALTSGSFGTVLGVKHNVPAGSAASNLVLDGTYLRTNTANISQSPISADHLSTTVLIMRNAVQHVMCTQSSSRGFLSTITSYAATSSADNCVTIGSAATQYGLYFNMVFRNCIFQGMDPTKVVYVMKAGSSNNTGPATWAGNGPGAPSVFDPAPQAGTVAFNNAAIGDFRVLSNEPLTAGLGLDLSTGGALGLNRFTTDANTDTRTTPWDRGAFKAIPVITALTPGVVTTPIPKTTTTLTPAWSAATGGTGPYQYQLQYGAGSSPSVWTNVGVPGSALTNTITGLTPNTVYSVRYVVTDAASATATSAAATQTTDAIVPPVLSLTTTDPAFAADYGSAAPAPVVRAITNSGGGGAITGLAATVTYAVGEPTGWLGTSLSATFTPSNLTMTPSMLGGTLVPRLYHATVNLTGDSVTPQAITVTHRVRPTSITDTHGHAKAYDGVGAEVVGAPMVYTVDRTDIVDCDASTGVCTVHSGASIVSPQIVTKTATSGAFSATAQFTVYPPGFF